MKPGGKDGFIYLVSRGAELTAVGDEGFGRITGLADTTGFPAANASVEGGKALEIDDLIYIKGSETLASGDKYIPFAIALIGGITDITEDLSKDKYEDTAQENIKDGVRSYSEGALTAVAGAISAYFDTESEVQRDVENRFRTIILDDGSFITKKERVSGVLELLLSYRETTEVGEIEVWEYLPLIVDSLSKQKPMDGNIPFNFNYTVDGKMKPRTYYRTIPA